MKKESIIIIGIIAVGLLFWFGISYILFEPESEQQIVRVDTVGKLIGTEEVFWYYSADTLRGLKQNYSVGTNPIDTTHAKGNAAWGNYNTGYIANNPVTTGSYSYMNLPDQTTIKIRNLERKIKEIENIMRLYIPNYDSLKKLKQ